VARLPAMILCAGLGTRLRPLTAWRAKPLVPIGDRPALGHVLERVAHVAARVVLNAHHRAEDLRSYAAESPFAPLVTTEDELLGTAGGLANAGSLLGDGDALVWNGYILADVDAPALARAHAGSAALATLTVRRGPAGTGNVGLDAQGGVVRLRAERVRGGEVHGGEFLGVHVLGGELRRALPARGCLVSDVYLPALRRGARLASFLHAGSFTDVGTLPEYLAANLAWLAGRAAHVAASADVGPDVALRGVVIGEGARVDGEGALTDVVVWPGAHVTAPLRRAIAAPEGIVRVAPAP